MGGRLTLSASLRLPRSRPSRRSLRCCSRPRRRAPTPRRSSPRPAGRGDCAGRGDPDGERGVDRDPEPKGVGLAAVRGHRHGVQADRRRDRRHLSRHERRRRPYPAGALEAGQRCGHGRARSADRRSSRPPRSHPPPPPPPPAMATPGPPVLPGPLGASPPPMFDPFPTVRIRGRLTADGARVTRLSVHAPHGVRIVASCRGRTCPTRRVARAAGIRLHRFERALRAGTRLDITVTKSGYIGKWTTSSSGAVRRRGAATAACFPDLETKCGVRRHEPAGARRGRGRLRRRVRRVRRDVAPTRSPVAATRL